jgi:hypothetical protein
MSAVTRNARPPYPLPAPSTVVSRTHLPSGPEDIDRRRAAAPPETLGERCQGSITNLFNTAPSVDLETYGGGALYRYTTLNQEGAIGRFFLLGATLKW